MLGCNTKGTAPAIAECLKDLQRFLRQDHPATRPAFTALSKYNVARADLVPLIVTYPADVELVFNARALFYPSPRSKAVCLSLCFCKVTSLCLRGACGVAVKVVTFLTMPLEPESENQPFQARAMRQKAFGALGYAVAVRQPISKYMQGCQRAHTYLLLFVQLAREG